MSLAESRPSQELAQLPEFGKWEGEATIVGEFVVQLGARRDLAEHQRWILTKFEDDEKCSLAGKENKGKGKSSHSKSYSGQAGKKKD